VTLRSDRWSAPKTLVFQKGAPLARRTIRIRGERQTTPTPVQYEVQLQKRGQTVYSYGPEPVLDNLITLRDRFVSRIPVYLEEDFVDGVTRVIANFSYEDQQSGFKWDTRVSLDKGRSMILSVPTLRDYPDKSELTLNGNFRPNGGKKAYTQSVQGNDTMF